MKRLWSISLAMLAANAWFAGTAQAQLANFNAANAAARDARLSGDNVALLANVRKLAALAPGHPSIQVALARALALNGDGAGAVAQLNRIADLGFTFGASADAAFQSLKEDPAFIRAAQRIAGNSKGLGRGNIIKPGLTGSSEGIAWSERSKSFLMGASGSIHAYKPEAGAPARPVANAYRPLILGIRPDPATRSYLVCVNGRDGSGGAVVRHHEANGAIMAIYKLPSQNALCNDIALLKNGSFAVTDSNNGAVFRLVGGELQPLALTTPIYQPNGIASDLDKGLLYVAHAGGVVVHELAAGRSREMAAAGTLIGAIDGMVLHKGYLLGVQNLSNAGLGTRLLRIGPDPDAGAAKVDVLLAGADFPGSATTVAVAGGEAFVIARIPEINGRPPEPILIRAPL